MQSAAIYEITTKASSLEIELPATAPLWTVLVDGASTKPQRRRRQTAGQLAQRRRTVSPRATRVRTRRSGSVSPAAFPLPRPKLLLRSGAEDERDTPQADLVWNLVLPAGFVVKQSSSTVEWQNPPRRIPAALIAGGKFMNCSAVWGRGRSCQPCKRRTNRPAIATMPPPRRKPSTTLTLQLRQHPHLPPPLTRNLDMWFLPLPKTLHRLRLR